MSGDEIKRIAITGAKGTIGKVLMDGLTGYRITPIDLPEVDVRNFGQFLKVVKSHDMIVHLAWDSQGTTEFESCEVKPDNLLMACNVYEAAVRTGVRRVIMASSVHADSYLRWEGPEQLRPDRVPVPDGAYGATKIFVESLGRYYATRGLEVICIRFGGVNAGDASDMAEEGYNKVWLSHRDCVALLRICIESESIPGGFVLLYGISNNTRRVHDYLNPFGWVPVDNADSDRSQ